MEIKDFCCYCGTCASVCPQNAIELLDSGEVEINKRKCAEYICRRWSCGICAKACPVGAILVGLANAIPIGRRKSLGLASAIPSGRRKSRGLASAKR